MTNLHQDETFDPAGPALVPDHAGDGGIAGAERNLLMAVLTDAIVHYGTSAELGRGPRPTASAEAARWILSNDRRWPFSFVNVCEALALDPSAVRRAVTNGRVPLTTRGRTTSRTAGPRQSLDAASRGATVPR